MLQKPSFIKRKVPLDDLRKMNAFLKEKQVNTVCNEAQCPNRGECFAKGHVTFIILGDTCTRSCSFCAIKTGRPNPIDPKEPTKVAESVERLGLKHAVITSVARDELKDQGSRHFAQTVREVKRKNPKTTIEVLIPDFKGSLECLQRVCDEDPEVLNHNMETIARLYKEVRPQAKYKQSLELLQRVKHLYPAMLTKSGFMVGLGETKEEIFQLIRDLKDVQLDILTIGQYLQPSKDHHDVLRYVDPSEYEEYKEYAKSIGIPFTFASPFVRSSYMADEVMEKIVRGK
jgi:lipoyl synthase